MVLLNRTDSDNYAAIATLLVLPFKFKIVDFKAVPHRYSLTKVQNPRRNLYIPVFYMSASIVDVPILNVISPLRIVSYEILDREDRFIYIVLNIIINLILSEAFLQCSLNCPFSGFLSHIVALVVELFTLAKTYLKLYTVALKINAQWYYRITLLLNLSEKLHNLFFMH